MTIRSLISAPGNTRSIHCTLATAQITAVRNTTVSIAKKATRVPRDMSEIPGSLPRWPASRGRHWLIPTAGEDGVGTPEALGCCTGGGGEESSETVAES